MTEILLLEPASIRETFREWHVERESLDAQLAESLTALAAYQSHLDTWQHELAQKRDELRKAREQFESDQAAAEKSKAHLDELTVEVSELRDKISSLNGSLTDRTEELNAQTKRRDELVAELEASRAIEKVGYRPAAAKSRLRKIAADGRVKRHHVVLINDRINTIGASGTATGVGSL